MFKILKADQRPRTKGHLCEMLSFLPFYSGYVKPFGDLTGIEEILVSPGGELVTEQEEIELLFLGRAGSLEVMREDSEPGLLKKNTCLISSSDGSEILLRNEREHGLSRMISLAFRTRDIPAPPRSREYLNVKFSGSRSSLQIIASGCEEEEDAIRLTLDAVVSLAQIGKGEKLLLETLPSRRILIAVLEGATAVEKSRLNKNDSVMVMGEPLVSFYAYEFTRVLIVDLPEYKSPFELAEAEKGEEKEVPVVSVWSFNDKS